MGDTKKAGRELDAEVAEKVMGWKRGRRYGNGNGEWIIEGQDKSFPTTWDHTPRYSTDIKAAWEVVEHLLKRFSAVEVKGIGGVFVCLVEEKSGEVDEHYVATTEGKTAPEAICLAALAATENKKG